MERGSAPPTLLRRRFSAAFSYFIPALYYDYFFPRSYLVLFSRFLLSTLGRLLLCTLRFYFAAFFLYLSTFAPHSLETTKQDDFCLSTYTGR